MNHDIVTIGASAGGVELLLDLVRDLPADLAAAVFIVLHMPREYESALPELLSKRGPLPARHPLHGEKIEPGTIYLAPNDMHLQLKDSAIEVVRGPKENGFRPAADVLFRTASAAYGSRVIGVVLSGYQDCGTAGMISIKARGGIGVVQDPRPPSPTRCRAACSPRSTSTTSCTRSSCPGCSRSSSTRRRLPVARRAKQRWSSKASTRVRAAMSFSLHSLVSEQGEQLERAVWAAIRALEESAALADRLSKVEKGEMHRRFMEKARTQRTQAELLKRMALHGATLGPEDAATVLPDH